jgi:16S rRNA (cytosine967-C5)-methyltransferase
MSDQQQQPQYPLSPSSPREEAYRVLMLARRDPDSFQDQFGLLKQVNFRGRFDLNLAIYLVSGTIKLQKRLDLILSKYLRKKLTSHSDSLITILRVGCFQLLPECNIPHYAAVNETVNLAKKYTPGAESMVNAVLKNIAQNIATLTFDELRADMLNYLTQYYSYPIWFVKELMTYYPEPVVEKFLRNGNDPQPLQMRLVDDAELIKQYLAKLQKMNIRFKQGKFLKNFIHIISDSNPTQLPGFESGKFIFQNEASGLVVELLNPLPNDAVLDLCAAPGGKTTDIAARVGSASKVTAVDISDLRLNLLRDNLKRLSIDNVLTVVGDGIKFSSGKYNKILVDAPCSGTGVFRKYPEGRWITTPEDVGRFAVMQCSLLNNAARLLSEGGDLVYSTCSVLHAENEFVIERFLNEHPDFELILPDWFQHKDVVGEDKFIRTFPGLKYFDNLFAACLRRKQS